MPRRAQNAVLDMEDGTCMELLLRLSSRPHTLKPFR